MGKPVNKKIYQAAVIAVAAEIIIGISLFFIPSLSIFTKLRLFAGFFIIIKSGYLFFYFEINHYLREEKLLRYSFILFPVMTSLFAGISALVWDVSSLTWVFNMCGVGLTLSILVSMTLLLFRYSLRSRKQKQT